MMNVDSDHRDVYISQYVTEHQLHNGHEHGHPPPSAGGSTSSAKQGSSTEAAFKCDFCTKSFTRKDHLVRHKANHSQQNHYCGTCQRAFKRLDLLQRHQKRQICTASDFPRPKRQRSSSASSGESDSQPPYSAFTQTYSNPHPNPETMLSEMPAISTDMGQNVNHLSGSTSSDQPHMLLDTVQTFANSGTGFPVDAIDFGLPSGLWPPESWEALFQNEVEPAWLDPQTLSSDLQFQSLTPRMQESAERGQISSASSALVLKLSLEFPDIQLDLNFITTSLNLYWSSVAPTFPFIHRGTFDLEVAPNELVLMMIITGSMNGPGARDFGRTVASVRGRMVQNIGLDMPNSTLQCFTLCHVYDTWYGTSDSLFISQCLWPVMVAHSRKKGIGVLGKTVIDSPQEEEAWAAWANDEERRRAVYCILLIDTQLSAFWNQHVSRELSIFAHHVALPCPRAQWEALTAGDWFRLRETTIPPPVTKPANPSRQKLGRMPGLHPEFQVHHVSEGYSSVVLETLAAENAIVKSYRADLENGLTVEMALMGLMAIAWDCRTRGGMGIRFREGTKHWRIIVINAVIHLRASWETNVQHLPAGTELRDMRDTFAISIISVLSDIPMLQVAAGAVQVCGSPIGNRQYTDAKRRLRLWAKSEDAWTCVWQSMRYIRQALYADWGIYTPWAIYLTTLVAWAYTTGTSDDHQPPDSLRGQNLYHNANQLVDTILSSSIRIEPKEHLGDLIAASAGFLDSEHNGGRVMQREMGQLLWRLLGDGKPRRPSTF